MKRYVSDILFFILFSSLILVTGSCSNEINFQRSKVVPAAEAEVKIEQDKNNNYEVEIEVENLAKPQNLHPPRNSYIAWYESSDYRTSKLGQIRISNNLKGSLETVIPRRPTRIFITAEDNAEVDYPQSGIVLETDHISEKKVSGKSIF